MKSRRKDEPEITARPKPMMDELAQIGGAESGLSVDPDELGAHFLTEATETATRRRPDGLSLSEASPTDEALSGPNFDSEQSVWENTVDVTVQDDDTDAPEILTEEGELDDEEFDASATLDMTRDNIREASLLDREGDEPGEVESPVVVTDDHHHPRASDDEEEPPRNPARRVH